MILAKGDTIMPEDLPKTVLESSSYEMVSKTPQNYGELKAKKRRMIEELEKDFVKHILSKYNNNIPQAAREAKMHRVELHRLVKKYKE